LPSLAACAVFLLTLVGTWRVTVIHVLDDRLNVALAGISTGLSPILPQTEDIWPQVGSDWFWKNQVPRTVNWLREIQAGPWRDLPPLGSWGGASYAALPLNEVRREPLPADVTPGYCRLTARLPQWGHAFPTSSVVVPVSDSHGVVVGFVAMTRRSAHRAVRSLEGFVLCAPTDTSPLFVPDAGKP
jgi:hypothetical protein